MAAQKKELTVSIVMTAYNRAGLLRRALESVLAQTIQEWELVIFDDASTDATPQILHELARRDARVRVFTNKTNEYPAHGITGMLNRGLEAAKGKYIARLDDDDAWLDPEKLKKQTAFLDSHPDCLVVGGGVVMIDPSGKELSRYLKTENDADIRKKALFANPFSHTTTMYRRKEALACGGYHMRLAEDWDLWLKLGTVGKLHNLPEYFTAYTVTGGNMSFLKQREQAKVVLAIISAHRKEYPHATAAYTLNFIQLCYSYLPFAFRKYLHAFLVHVKRSLF